MWGVNTTELEHTALGVIVLLLLIILVYFGNKILNAMIVEARRANASLASMSLSLHDVAKSTEESAEHLDELKSITRTEHDDRESEHREIIDLLKDRKP